ncbi:ATP-binding protein [Flagellimonas baculiformis]|uniref:ATP-binding protein n=1 Tax=Flagellimonas baculiformis TaxID=3067310 RepID=UPI00296E2C2A|nr:ATP-binding protein [Muricauda sp. D6]
MNNLFDFDEIRNLTIGTVESVSPTEIKVMLETNAPQNVAINTGVPTHFPKINGYVLIPNEQGALVAVIHWIGIQHSNYPKRKGFKDFDLIDLPFPLRKMSLTPLGVLRKKKDNSFEIERGVYSFPSVGDNVILPTDRQLTAIVENPDGKFEIGRAPIASNSPIKVNPDKLFGRHLAVLGNTGSGKSCSVAGMIRWSLQEAEKNKTKEQLNARFIILDPNGEYFDAFNDLGDKKVRKLTVKLDETDSDFEQLKIPAWMWNSQEWINFSQAAPGAQRPLLLQSLLNLKRGENLNSSDKIRLGTFLKSTSNSLNVFLTSLPTQTRTQPFIEMCKVLDNISNDFNFHRQFVDDNDMVNYDNLIENFNTILTKRRWAEGRYNPFSFEDINSLKNFVDNYYSDISIGITPSDSINPDTPLYFELDDLIPHLEQLAQNQGGNILQFVQMLSLRMRFLFADERLNGVVQPKEDISLVDWLNLYIGSNNAENGQITLIDLSLIPSDIIHIVVAVLSRLTFEAIQRFRKIYKKELPTTIVLEEAHTFLREFSFDNSNICLETFERIAREGRKFGLSMVLSSQRPSELSQTVLSQCNTFLLHRIVNDKDQDLVKRLVPDSLSGLLKELPILPSRKAILVGWAFPIPVLVEMRFLEKKHQPRSNDPDFWKVWTGELEREVDWDKIGDDWQGKNRIENIETEEEKQDSEVVELTNLEPEDDNEIDNPDDDLPF